MGRKLLAIGLATTVLGGLAWAYPRDDRAPVAHERVAATHPASLDATQARGAQSRQASGGEAVLMTDHSGDISGLDPSTGKILFDAKRAILSPSGDRVYERRRTNTVIIDGKSGRRLGDLRSPRDMELQVASASGRSLAFAVPKPGGTEWMPAGRARTKITVSRTAGPGRTRTYDLKGNYGIEAFSSDDRQLFLLEYMPAKNPWHYGLRRLVLATGEVRHIKRSKQNAPGEMNGTGRLAEFSPTGHELYTLYTQQGFNYTHVEPQDARPGEVYAFIHLLNLDGAWTHCIDLPAPFGTGTATTHAMAVSDDGSRLYVADPSSGGLAVIDPRGPRVLRAVTTDLRFLRDGASATVSSDGTLYLASHHQVIAFDGASLRKLRSLRSDPAISGITTSADGSKLYAGARGRLLVLDAATGRRVDTVRVRGSSTLVDSL